MQSGVTCCDGLFPHPDDLLPVTVHLCHGTIGDQQPEHDHLHKPYDDQNTNPSVGKEEGLGSSRQQFHRHQKTVVDQQEYRHDCNIGQHDFPFPVNVQLIPCIQPCADPDRQKSQRIEQ